MNRIENPRGASLRRNVLWALVGNVGYAAFQWGILISIAKLGTAEAVGQFALGLAMTAPVITFTNLHLRILEATDARGEFPFATYFSLRLVTTTLAFASIAVIGFVTGYRGVTLVLIVVVGLAKSFEAVSDVIFGLLQEAEKLRRIAVSMLAKGFVSVLAIALGLYWTHDLVLAALGMAFGWLLLLCFYDLPAAIRLASVRPNADARALWSLARMAAPMGCVAALGSLTTNVPRYTVEAHLGATALGHFAAVAYLFVAGGQPMMAVAAAVMPRLAHHFVNDLDAFRRLTLRTALAAAALGVAGVIVAVVAGPFVLKVAYAPEYAAEAPALCWMAAAAGVGFVGKALGASVTAARRLTEQLPIAVGSLVVAAIASFVLVPRWGLVGAAWAVLATETARLVCIMGIYLQAVADAVATPHSALTADEAASTDGTLVAGGLR